MLETAPPVRVVLTTAANPDEAARLGRALVEERLAACASLIPGVESIYRWQGKVETAAETLLLLKTGPDQLEALEARLRELHSYETPEFLVLKVDAASQPALPRMATGELAPSVTPAFGAPTRGIQPTPRLVF
jgi:periplasmic divalent cation tolerance protein